jgi:hypothetical protein
MNIRLAFIGNFVLLGEKTCGLDHSCPDHIYLQKPELSACFLCMHVIYNLSLLMRLGYPAFAINQ